jgi:DNA-binding transcriptional MerR regulator
VRNGSAGELSIGDFARLSGLSISALRLYAAAGVLVPARVDPWTGYRYYLTGQVDPARLVGRLRALEVALPVIRDLLASPPPERHRLLDAHWGELERAHRRRRAALAAARLLLDHEEASMSTSSCTVHGKSLAHALTQVLPAAGPIGKEDHRLAACVLFELRPDCLRLAATDGHRLAVRDLPATVTGTGTAVVATEHLAPLAGRVAADHIPVKLAEHSVWIGDHELPSLGTYFPDYGRFLAEGSLNRLSVDPTTLRSVLKPDGGSVRFDLEAGGVRVDGAPLDAEYAGVPLTIALNPAFVLAALDAGRGQGDVALKLGGPEDPVVLRWSGDRSFTVVVMPIRLLEPAPA